MPKGDLNNQLQIQQQINKILQDREASLQRQSTSISGQVNLAMELCKALECRDLEGMEERLGGIQQTLRSVADEASRSGDNLKDVTDGLEDMADAQETTTGKFKASRVAAVGFFAGLVRGGKVGKMQVLALMEGAKRLATAFYSVGAAIISIPFKMLSGLISMSNMFSGGAPVIKQAWEEVRETFGDLGGPTGTALKGMFKDIRKESGSLAGSGRSLRKTFGIGREGMAAAIKFLNEQAQALGPLLHQLTGEIKELGGPALAVFVKGLGLSGDQLKAMALHGRAAGKTLSETLTEITKMSKGMGKRFNMDSKEIARSMAELSADFEHFGTLSQKELAETAVYAKKLGIEVKELGGIIDKFLNFEDAAESAAKLQQVFGVNIDTMKMMELAAKGDGKALSEELRQGLRAAGKDFDSMDLAQRRVLASSVGLTEQNLALMMSEKNRSVSLKDIKKGGDDVAKGQMSQKEATKALGKDMTKVFATGSKTFKSFSDAVSQGFLRGVMRGKGFRKMLRNVRKSLMVTYRFGIKLGKMFVETFPGMQKMVKGLTEMFDPKKFKAFLGPPGGVLGVFEMFFKDLSAPGGPAKAVPKMLSRMKEQFKTFFSKQGSGGSEFLEGVKLMIKAAVGTILFMIPEFIRGFATMIRALTDLLKNPPQGPPTTFAEEMGMMIIAAFKEMGKALADDLWPAIKELWDHLWENHRDVMIKTLAILFGIIFAKAIVAGVITSVVSGAVMLAIAGIGKFLSGGMALLAGRVPSLPGVKKMQAVNKQGGGMAAGLKNMVAVLTGAGMNTMKIMEAVAKIALLSTALIPVMISFAVGLKAAMFFLGGVDMDRVIKFMLAMVPMIFGIQVMSNALVKMEKLDSKKMMGQLGLMAVMMGMMVIFGLALGYAINAFGAMEIKFVDMAMFFITLTGGIIGVVALTMLTQMMPSAGTVNQAISAMVPLALMMAALVLFGVALAWGIKKAAKDLPKREKIEDFMLTIALAFINVLIMLPSILIIGALMSSGVGALIFILGIIGVAALMGVLSSELIPSLARATVSLTAAGGAGAAVKTVQAMGDVVRVISANLWTFFKLGVVMALGWFFNAWGMMKNGVRAVGELAKLLIDSVIPPLVRAMNMPGFDADKMVKTVQALSGIVTAVSALASIGPGMVKDFSKMKDIKPSEMKGLINSATDLMDVTMTGTATLVQTIISAVQGLSTADILKAKTAAVILDAVGQLAGSMAPPDSMINAVKDEDVAGDDPHLAVKFAQLFGNYANLMDRMLGVFTHHIPRLVGAIFSVKIPPELAASPKQLKLIAAAMDIAAKFSTTFKTMAGVAMQVGGGAKVDVRYAEDFQRVMRNYKTVMAEVIISIHDNLPTIIEAVLKAASGITIPGAMSKKLDVITKAMEVASKFGAMVKNIMNIVPAEKAKEGEANAVKLAADGRVPKIGRMIAAVSKMIIGGGTDKPGMGQIIKHVLAIASGKDIPDKKGPLNLMVQKMSVLVKVFEVALKLTEMLTEINALAPGLGDQSAGKRGDASAGLRALMVGLIDMIKGGDKGKGGLGQLVKALGDAAKEISGSKNFTKQVKNFSTLMEAVPGIIEAMGPIKELAGGTALTKETVQGMGLLFTGIWNVIAGVDGSMGIKAFAKKLRKISGKTLATAATTIAEISGTLSEMFSSMSTLITLISSSPLLAQAGGIAALSEKSKTVLESVGMLLFGSNRGYEVLPGSLLHFGQEFSKGISKAQLAGAAGGLGQGIKDITNFIANLALLLQDMSKGTFQKRLNEMWHATDRDDQGKEMALVAGILFGSGSRKYGGHTFGRASKWSLSMLAGAAGEAANAGAFKDMKSTAGQLDHMRKFAVMLGGTLKKLVAVAWGPEFVKDVAKLKPLVQANVFEVVAQAFQGLIDIHNIIQGGAGITLSGVIDTVGEFVELQNKEIVVAASEKIVINLDAHFTIDADELAHALSSDKTKGKTRTVALTPDASFQPH